MPKVNDVIKCPECGLVEIALVEKPGDERYLVASHNCGPTKIYHEVFKTDNPLYQDPQKILSPAEPPAPIRTKRW